MRAWIDGPSSRLITLRQRERGPWARGGLRVVSTVSDGLAAHRSRPLLNVRKQSIESQTSKEQLGGECAAQASMVESKRAAPGWKHRLRPTSPRSEPFGTPGSSSQRRKRRSSASQQTPPISTQRLPTPFYRAFPPTRRHERVALRHVLEARARGGPPLRGLAARSHTGRPRMAGQIRLRPLRLRAEVEGHEVEQAD